MRLKLIFLCFLIGFVSCTHESYEALQDQNILLNLKFHAYPNATNEDARIGLSWALSQIGAKKTALFFDGIIRDNDIFTINISLLGFNENTQFQLLRLHNKIKETQAYQNNNFIDLGRYISLIIGASEHYYKLNNIPESLEDILSNYDLNLYKGYVNNSDVSNSHRIIEFSNQNNLNQLFLATEITPNSNSVIEYETIEIMENGHLKFGIYDVNGNRKNNASLNITNAGKPAKCMWCHESKIQPLFSVQNNVPNFLSYNQLQDTLLNFRLELNQKQLDLINGVNFGNSQDHVKMELAYISFMEPSALVLSKEWNMTILEVETLLSPLQTHIYDEFPFLGNLYNRHDIEQFSPYTSLTVSTSVREQSQLEVNHLD